MNMCTSVPSPCYVLDEKAFRRNLSLIRSVKERAGIEIILAFKAFALWKVFPIVREYISYSTASSLSEALLAVEEMKSKAHTYAPVYRPDEIETILNCSSHISFNSLAQYQRYGTLAREKGVSCGLRINPSLSKVATDLYNPCVPGSRLGVLAINLDEIPEGIEGLHFHGLCESSSYDLEAMLNALEAQFGKHFGRIQWLNLGGGHLMTRAGYDIDHLIKLLTDFKSRYPNLQIILEPGSAFAWQTGDLYAAVLDIVENAGIKTAILDVSFSCHMPDCLEMPYQPVIEGAVCATQSPSAVGHSTVESAKEYRYRLGGNSCLAGDYIGDWVFDEALQVGQVITIKDMLHYTTVKTTLFNGVSHPAIALRKLNGSLQILREFNYTDYKNRMS